MLRREGEHVVVRLLDGLGAGDPPHDAELLVAPDTVLEPPEARERGVLVRLVDRRQDPAERRRVRVLLRRLLAEAAGDVARGRERALVVGADNSREAGDVPLCETSEVEVDPLVQPHCGAGRGILRCADRSVAELVGEGKLVAPVGQAHRAQGAVPVVGEERCVVVQVGLGRSVDDSLDPAHSATEEATGRLGVVGLRRIPGETLADAGERSILRVDE